MTWQGSFKIENGKYVDGSLVIGGNPPDGTVNFGGWENESARTRSVSVSVAGLSTSAQISLPPEQKGESDGD